MHPGANGREEAIKNVTTGMELQLSRVIVVAGPYRSNQCDVIDAIAQVRPPVGKFDATLAEFPISDLHGKNLAPQL